MASAKLLQKINFKKLALNTKSLKPLLNDAFKAIVCAVVLMALFLGITFVVSSDKGNTEINAVAPINLAVAPIKITQTSLNWSNFTKNERGLNLPIITRSGSVFENFKVPLSGVIAPNIKHKTAMIIANLGYDRANIDEVFKILNPLSAVAINPYAPYAQDVTKKALAKGFEIWLHVPAKNSANLQEALQALDHKVPAPDNIAILTDAMSKASHYVGVYISPESNILTSQNDMDPLMNELARRGLGLITPQMQPLLSTLQMAETLKIPFIGSASNLDILPILPVITQQLDAAIDNSLDQEELLIVVPSPNIKLIREAQNYLSFRTGKSTNFVPPSNLAQ